MKKVELLAPAGDKEKFYTALHFGADAVYLAGQTFGLRAYAGNFNIDEIADCCSYAHSLGKKVYVTVNIYANDEDFDTLDDYLIALYNSKVDGILVSDLGVFSRAKIVTPNLPLHVSTQANTTNKYAVKFWSDLGAQRVVVARECTLVQIKEMIDFNKNVEIETFVHGAMCISYSGRCLLSNYLTNRSSNRGECVQACRWKYDILPEGHDEPLTITEDQRGSYIFNSRDLNMIEHIDDLINANISSLKIEGRMKSPYYVATVVNAYRRAIDNFYNKVIDFAPTILKDELTKASHRAYSTGFFYGRDNGEEKQYYPSSRAVADSAFIAVVVDYKDQVATIEMRNRFNLNDELEILSNNDSFNKVIKVTKITTLDGEELDKCIKVQQIVNIPCPYPLNKRDILRAKSNKNAE